MRLPITRRADTANLPRFALTPRDVEIVRAVYEYRALTTPQIEALFFSPSADEPQSPRHKIDTRCQHRLSLLYHAGYLFRDEQPTKLSEGRRPLVYFLDERGAALLSDTLRVPRAQLDWRSRDNDVSWPFLEHLLATNTIRIAVTISAKANGYELLRWIDDKSLRRAEQKDYVVLRGPSGSQQRVAVVPDGYFALKVGKRIYHRFLETDLGTVTGQASKPGRRDWARKVAAYLEYYKSGGYLRRYGAQGIRVLTVTTTDSRLHTLQSVTEASGGRQLFLFTTFARLASADALTGPIWRQPHVDGLQALVP
jgi:hypothetical protein